MIRTQQHLRLAGKQARATMTEEARDAASEKITENIVSSNWFQRAGYIACYLSADEEVNTWATISRAWAMKKRIFAPVIEKKSRLQFQEVTAETELRLNRYGLFEPADGETVTARMLDIVLTPVVAFDDTNNRIGMGGGYYDRTFSFLRNRGSWLHPKLVGLAFACQKVEKIPPNPWDIRLFRTITEKS